MPMITDFNNKPFVDPDTLAAPVVTIGATAVTSGIELDVHHHRKAQLILLMRGVMTCEIEGGLWMVPPQGALWIPGGVPHSVKASGSLEGYNAFIEPAFARKLPESCCTIAATPLLRELMIRSASFPITYPDNGFESQLVKLLLDEAALAPAGELHLPMPADGRLRKIARMMMDDPRDQGTMQHWARRAGMGERTLARVIVQETGMTFGRWRQQLDIVLALRWLADGATVQRVALDLGYENAGSFVTMFKKALGTSPGRYMAERQGLASARAS